MGDSPRDEAAQRSYEEIGNIDPNVENLFEGYKSKFSAEDILASIDDYTEKAIGNVHKRTGSNISRSNRNVAGRLAGQGIKGGAISEDALAAGSNRENIRGSRQIEGLQEGALKTRPGVLDKANMMDFNITGANQNVLFQNLANLFKQKGMKAGAGNMLNDDTWFDDFLALANTGANVIDASTPDSVSCCFIMIAGNNGVLHPVVRRYRDEFMEPIKRAGYIKIAAWLVPLMKKSVIIKWIVKMIMTMPLTSYGKYYYGYNKFGAIFKPVKDFWMKVFYYNGVNNDGNC